IEMMPSPNSSVHWMSAIIFIVVRVEPVRVVRIGVRLTAATTLSEHKAIQIIAAANLAYILKSPWFGV
ncbi:MAG: hypothetical protein AAFY21_06645, partial [Cyanobacteria bacterium J06641_2]